MNREIHAYVQYLKKKEHCYTYRIGQHSQLAIIKLIPTPCQRIICSESDGSVSTSNTCIPACSTTAVMLLLSSNKQSHAPCMSCECAAKNKNLWNILTVCVIEERQQNCWVLTKRVVGHQHPQIGPITSQAVFSLFILTMLLCGGHCFLTAKQQKWHIYFLVGQGRFYKPINGIKRFAGVLKFRFAGATNSHEKRYFKQKYIA